MRWSCDISFLVCLFSLQHPLLSLASASLYSVHGLSSHHSHSLKVLHGVMDAIPYRIRVYNIICPSILPCSMSVNLHGTRGRVDWSKEIDALGEHSDLPPLTYRQLVCAVKGARGDRPPCRNYLYRGRQTLHPACPVWLHDPVLKDSQGLPGPGGGDNNGTKVGCREQPPQGPRCLVH